MPKTMPADQKLSKGCKHADPHLVARVKDKVTYRTEAALSGRLGISYNTWRKLVAGQPIRASLLARLEARVEAIELQQIL